MTAAMYRCFGLVVTAAILWVPAVARADVHVQFAHSKQCLACHQVDTKRVGPSFRAIAQRYAGASGAGSYLADTIRDGSRGKWGAIPMPAQAQVSVVDSLRLATWILSLEENSALD